MNYILKIILMSEGTKYLKRDYDFKNTLIFELKETILLMSFLFSKGQYISKGTMI